MNQMVESLILRTATEHYISSMHDAYDTWDEKRRKDSKVAAQEAACMVTPKHRKLREEAFYDAMKTVKSKAETMGDVESIRYIMDFATILSGPDKNNVPKSKKHSPEQIYGYYEYLSPNADEIYLVAMFIMDDIVSQGKEQWYKLCNLYREQYSNEYADKVSDNDIWDEISMQNLIFGSVPLFGPDWILGGIVKTISSLDTTGTDKLFVTANPRKRRFNDFQYNDTPKNEREKWESLIALMHPDTVQDACRRFQNHAWDVLKEFSHASQTITKRLAEKLKRRGAKMPVMPKANIPMSSSPMSMNMPTKNPVMMPTPSPEDSKTLSLFVAEWHHPYLCGRGNSQIPWDWESMKGAVEGIPAQPELAELKQEEAQSLLFAAVLMFDCADTIMYLPPLASWVLRKAVTMLPIAPTHAQLAKQVTSMNITQDEAEQAEPPKRVWRNDLWCITIPDKNPCFIPTLPEDREQAKAAMSLLTKEQFRFMLSRCILPMPFTYHAMAPIRQDRTRHIVTRPVPDKYRDLYPDTDAYMNMLVCIANTQKYTAAYVIRQQVREYKEITRELEELKEQRLNAPPVEVQSDELSTVRAALKSAEELIRQKNDEIRRLREQLGEQMEEDEEVTPEESSVDAQPITTEEPEDVIEVPQKYSVQNKTIIVGGAKAFVKNLQKVLEGDVRYIDINTERPDLSMCLGGTVYIQTFYLSHKLSEPVVAYCKKNKIPIQYCESSGAPACIRQIIKYDKRMTKAAQRREGA